MKIAFVSNDLEKVSYCMESIAGARLLTSTDQKDKSWPKKWSVTFFHIHKNFNTLGLLTNPRFKDFIFENSLFFLSVFKNSYLIELIAQKNNLKLLNPPSFLIEKIEGKISQVFFFEKLKNYFPQFIIFTPESCTFEDLVKILGNKIVAQFNTSHSGEGTFLLDSTLWQVWCQKFPKRPIRLSRFIQGENLTLNLLVLPQGVLSGQLSLQLTGLESLTDQKFATVGNSWIDFDSEILQQAKFIGTEVGGILRENNFFGSAGLDFVYDKNTRQLYLIEVNARQTASFNLENWLVKLAGGRPIFDVLINYWQGKILDRSAENFTKISGGQIVWRASQDCWGILHQIPATGIYVIKDHRVIYQEKRIILKNSHEFLIFTKPISRSIAVGEEILKIQTGDNFLSHRNELLPDVSLLMAWLKKETKFGKIK
ncbi:MAG TPA: ATP-grasp domain-containing protein [bacterium]|nr:ATP-grasp domain-containing protein [bacterium]